MLDSVLLDTMRIFLIDCRSESLSLHIPFLGMATAVFCKRENWKVILYLLEAISQKLQKSAFSNSMLSLRLKKWLKTVQIYCKH